MSSRDCRRSNAMCSCCSTVAVDARTFTVPSNRSVPGGEPLTLRFVRFRTTAEKPRAPIVMVLAGVEGPDDTMKDPARVDAVLATIAAVKRP